MNNSWSKQFSGSNNTYYTMPPMMSDGRNYSSWQPESVLNDKIKQDKILKLIPDIRKYFSFTSVIGASEPDKAKRPYLSIIRQLTKSKYNMLSCDYRIKEEEKEDIRTKKY